MRKNIGPDNGNVKNIFLKDRAPTRRVVGRSGLGSRQQRDVAAVLPLSMPHGSGAAAPGQAGAMADPSSIMSVPPVIDSISTVPGTTASSTKGDRLAVSG